MLNWRREMRTIGLPAILVVLAALLAAGRANPSRLNPRDGLTYQWILPGSYFTGCLPGDQECYGLERKREKIDIPQGFWIGRIEVTQAVKTPNVKPNQSASGIALRNPLVASRERPWPEAKFVAFRFPWTPSKSAHSRTYDGYTFHGPEITESRTSGYWKPETCFWRREDLLCCH